MCCVLWKRYVGWTLFVSVLIGLGVGIYRMQPHEPRWTVTSFPASYLAQFSADGKWLTTTDTRSDKWIDLGVRLNNHAFADLLDVKAPANIWNVDTGFLIKRLPAAGEFSIAMQFSKNRRYFVFAFDRATPKDEEARPVLQICNLETREAHDIPIPPNEMPVTPCFSPCNKYMVVAFHNEKNKSSRVCVYNAATGLQMADRPTHSLISEGTVAEDCLVHLAPGKDGKEIEIWSLTEGKVVGKLDHADNTARLSPDGRYLLSQRRAPDEHPGMWRIWDLRARKRSAEWLLDFNIASVVFSPNREEIIVRVGPRYDLIERRSLATGERLAHLNDPRLGSTLAFSPDGRLLIAADAPVRHMGGWVVPNRGLRVLDADTLKERWNDGQAQASTCAFTPDSKRILQIFDAANEVRVLDSATGELLATVALPPNQSARLPALTPDGRSFVVHRNHDDMLRLWFGLMVIEPWWKKTLRWTGIDPERFSSANRDHAVVYDLENDRESLRLVGWNVSDALLSDDGNTLVTLHEEEGGRVMRSWDVHAWKPLRWAAGVPIGLGIGLIGIAKGWARWRKRKIATPAPPPVNVS